jgi:hypothetical protein
LLVDRLDAGGWVRRTKHASDRRPVLVELAPTMPAADLEPTERYHAAIEAVARRLSADERAAATRFLDAVTERAAETTARALGRERGEAESRPECVFERLSGSTVTRRPGHVSEHRSPLRPPRGRQRTGFRFTSAG